MPADKGPVPVPCGCATVARLWRRGGRLHRSQTRGRVSANRPTAPGASSARTEGAQSARRGSVWAPNKQRPAVKRAATLGSALEALAEGLSPRGGDAWQILSARRPPRNPRESSTLPHPSWNCRRNTSRCYTAARGPGGWRERSVPVEDLSRYLEWLLVGQDIYLSQARFHGPRKIVNLRRR